MGLGYFRYFFATEIYDKTYDLIRTSDIVDRLSQSCSIFVEEILRTIFRAEIDHSSMFLHAKIARAVGCVRAFTHKLRNNGKTARNS